MIKFGPNKKHPGHSSNLNIDILASKKKQGVLKIKGSKCHMLKGMHFWSNRIPKQTAVEGP